MIAAKTGQRSMTVLSHRTSSPSRMVPLLVLMTLSYFHGCATPEQVAPVLSNREATIGKTKESLLTCAGQPIREAVTDHSQVLLYYKEAPMLQESFPASKGSFARPHYGCWASVLLEGDRVTDIGYRSVPSTMDALNLCEAIFEGCHP